MTGPTSTRFLVDESGFASPRFPIATEHTMQPQHEPNEHDQQHEDSTPSTERAPTMAARVALDFAVSQLGPDEQRVLTRIAERLTLGATTYGPLSLVSDPRSFRSKEAREEVDDALVYLACAWLKGEEVAA